MPSTVLDSLVLRDLLSTPQMRDIFADRALIARYVEVEIALAKAQGQCGVIPLEAAKAIAACAKVDALDFDRLRQETTTVGFPILPLVHQLADLCGDAGRYLHWGATTQDIMDTAVVLQIRDALALVDADLGRLRESLAHMAKRYRDTPMAGRTHMQHALPITFGYKVAVWLSMFDRHSERLQQLRPRVLVGQLGGAVGTLAALGKRGLDVQHALMRELNLDVPKATWHVARDGFAEVVTFLALVSASLAKIACDISLMSATEIAEVSEPFVKGRGASSTMPQKKNPISSELIIAAAKAVRQQASLMLEATVQDFERGTGPWQVEWLAIPESFLYTSAALAHANFVLSGLVVDEKRMRDNLDLTSGLIVSEAVVVALAPMLGRHKAHDIVSVACRVTEQQGGSLVETLAAIPEVATYLDRAAIERLTDPTHYVGMAREIVDRVVGDR